jgi:hypothetical protein
VQVVGSSSKTKFEMRDGKAVLMRLPEVNFIDDKEGKPLGLHQFIGRRPRLAFGNSDGDHQMLQWTAAGSGLRFMGLVHHGVGKIWKTVDGATLNLFVEPKGTVAHEGVAPKLQVFMGLNTQFPLGH